MREKMKWLERYAPLGIGVEKQVSGFVVGMIAATLHSMWFFVEYLHARNELYIRKSTGRVLMEGAIMRDFSELTEYLFLTFYVVGAVTLVSMVFFYFYHYDGSKMLYLMKRLPDKHELRRRCITLPIAGTVILTVWAMLLRMIYFSVYMLCTPSQCLPL